MDIISSKIIKQQIFNTVDCDIDELEKILIGYLTDDEKESIKGISDSLIVLFNNYIDNKLIIDEVLNIIEHYIKNNNLINKELFIKRFNKLIVKLEDNQDKDIYLRLEKIINYVEDELVKEKNDKQLSYLKYLVFQEKNFDLFQRYVFLYPDVLDLKDSNGNTLFDNVLKMYVSLDDYVHEEVDYYFHIIMLLIKENYDEVFLTDNKRLVEYLEKYDVNGKGHVHYLKNLFSNNSKLSIQDVEERYGIKFNFSNDIENEVNNFIFDNEGRIDFTNQECITIDDKDASCLDDALYIEKNRDGTFNLYIHIADIPSFVPYNSLTNWDAIKREESIYLRDEVINLYPDRIGNNLCSLLPNNNRNVISYIFKLDNNYEVIDNSFRIEKGKIKVRHKLSYNGVDNILRLDNNDSLSNMLRHLACFSIKRRKSNKAKESYRKLENILKPKPYHESLNINESLAANIVHESMILVNYMAASYFKVRDLPYIYRSVTYPDKDFLDGKYEIIENINSYLLQDGFYRECVRASYIESGYSTKPVRHDGLNLNYYSHSSSPDRRYPDGLGQYIIYDFIFDSNLDDLNIYSWEVRLEKLVSYLNRRKKENDIFIREYHSLLKKNLIRK